MRNQGCGPRRFSGSRFGRGPCGRPGGLVTGGYRWTAWQLGLPGWVVAAFFVVLFLTIGWPALLVYLACALLLRPDRADGVTARDDGVSGIDLSGEAQGIRDRARDLEGRIAGLESRVTSREFDFDRRLAAADRPDRRRPA
ncbi:MAG: hypothetical protein ACP59X_20925 [Solidesulfovibrio sp. DCME]|uniref:hypothetical protein n=1 Tax=Solidesulfovibrio sp. DCME TaxID=3447380 RepID=UPI003D0A952A